MYTRVQVWVVRWSDWKELPQLCLLAERGGGSGHELPDMPGVETRRRYVLKLPLKSKPVGVFMGQPQGRNWRGRSRDAGRGAKMLGECCEPIDRSMA